MPRGRVEEPHRLEHSLDLHAGRVQRHEHHRVLVVAVGARVGEAHEDECLAVGVPDAGAPPLAPVEHDLVALEHGGGLHVCRVRGRHVGLGHTEGGADAPVQQRLEPALALLRGAKVQQHLHIAAVRRVAVAHLRRDQRAAHALGERRVLDVGEAGAVALIGEEQVPQAFLLGLRLELVDHSQHDPRVAAREQLAVIRLLTRSYLSLLKGDQARQQLLRAIGVLEIHCAQDTALEAFVRRVRLAAATSSRMDCSIPSQSTSMSRALS